MVYLQRWHGWCQTKLLPFRRVRCTPCNHAPCHFMQSQTRKVHACFAVTCHLHFWQNDRDLLRATAVTRGWNGYHRVCVCVCVRVCVCACVRACVRERERGRRTLITLWNRIEYVTRSHEMGLNLKFGSWRYLHVSNLQVLLVILIFTAVARKRPRSFCQKCRWQVTAKHAYTLRMWLCTK